MSVINRFPEIRKGRFLEELNQAVADTVKACLETGKPGSVTIKLSFDPLGETIALKDQITPKLPKPDKAPTTFFATEEGQLSRNNPKQTEMPFTALAEPASLAAAN